MSDRAGILGAFVGIGVVFLAAWFGYQFVTDKTEAKLPLKARQAIKGMQGRLPVELQKGVILEQFDLSRNHVEFTVRYVEITQPRKVTQQKSEIMRYVFHSWFCNWRDQVSGKSNFDILITVLAANGAEVVRLVNTIGDCPPVPPQRESRI